MADHPQLAPVDPVADLVAPATPDPLLDCDGHGTVVAGVIREVAPGATILSVRQSSAHYRQPDADPAGTLASLADAIHAALDAGAQVLNISVVSCVPADQAALLDAAVLDHALLRAEEQGVVVVSASGNNGGACLPGRWSTRRTPRPSCPSPPATRMIRTPWRSTPSGGQRAQRPRPGHHQRLPVR
ncbi:S8 family serine peptidase [Corynebacterium suedekumii]|nr:S8 family serine peptidase [Corynebacterium suedekumii]